MIASAVPLVSLAGRFGTRFEVRVEIDGMTVEIPVVHTDAVGTTVLIPRNAQNGRTLRRDSYRYPIAIASARADVAAALSAVGP